MMQSGPISTVTQLNRWEVDCMEVHVIFPHELEQTDVLRVQPPLFPLRRVVGCDAQIADWSIKLKELSAHSLSEEKCQPEVLTHTSISKDLSVK
jgi:hypothetical protein